MLAFKKLTRKLGARSQVRRCSCRPPAPPPKMPSIDITYPIVCTDSLFACNASRNLMCSFYVDWIWYSLRRGAFAKSLFFTELAALPRSQTDGNPSRAMFLVWTCIARDPEIIQTLEAISGFTTRKTAGSQLCKIQSSVYITQQCIWTRACSAQQGCIEWEEQKMNVGCWLEMLDASYLARLLLILNDTTHCYKNTAYIWSRFTCVTCHPARPNLGAIFKVFRNCRWWDRCACHASIR